MIKRSSNLPQRSATPPLPPTRRAPPGLAETCHATPSRTWAHPGTDVKSCVNLFMVLKVGEYVSGMGNTLDTTRHRHEGTISTEIKLQYVKLLTERHIYDLSSFLFRHSDSRAFTFWGSPPPLFNLLK